jgi:tetratricopeptide (TPR) repeat protein
MTRATTFILVSLWSLLLAAPLTAQEENVQGGAAQKKFLEAVRAEREEKLERYHLRALTQKRMNTANELFESGQFAKARENLEKLNPNRLNAYERALVYRLLAYAAIGQEDPAGAVEYFEKVVEEQVLPIEDDASALFSVAQIQASLEQWGKVEATLEQWFRLVERPNGAAYYLVAISRYQHNSSPRCISNKKTSIAPSRSSKSW